MPAAIWPDVGLLCPLCVFPAPLCRVGAAPRSCTAMSSKRAHLNFKRSERRKNLAARLELAERDAGTLRNDEQTAKRTKPTRAPYLVEAKEEPEASEEKDDEPSPGEAVAFPEGGAETAGAEPGTEDTGYKYQGEQIDSSGDEEDASTWMERGRVDKLAAGKRRASPRKAVRLRSADEARRKSTKISLHEAPWRAASSHGFDEGPLVGGRDVVPRWKIEEKLERSERGGHGKQHSTILLGKVATQLLRWGRSDIRGDGGAVKSVKLCGWKPGAWVTVAELADTMGVRPELLGADVLDSSGSHGPRLLYQERQGDRGPRVKACWTER